MYSIKQTLIFEIVEYIFEQLPWLTNWHRNASREIVWQADQLEDKTQKLCQKTAK